MYKEFTCYTIICDNCGRDAMEEADHSGYTDKEGVLDDAKEGGFIEHEGNHYCENCWQYDDNDNIVINSL